MRAGILGRDVLNRGSNQALSACPLLEAPVLERESILGLQEAERPGVEHQFYVATYGCHEMNCQISDSSGDGSSGKSLALQVSMKRSSARSSLMVSDRYSLRTAAWYCLGVSPTASSSATLAEVSSLLDVDHQHSLAWTYRIRWLGGYGQGMDTPMVLGQLYWC